MKRSTLNLTLAAAAMMVASTAASAQSNLTLKAEIPFSFRAGGAVMPPGSYEVAPSYAESRFYIRSAEQNRSVILITRETEDVPKEWVHSGSPKLQFACGGEGCALQRIWTGKAGAGAHVMPVPKQNGGQLGLIRVVSAKAR